MPHGSHEAVIDLPVVRYEVVDPDALIPPLVDDRPAQHYGFNAGAEWEYAQGGEGDSNGTGRYLRWLQPMEEELAKQVEYDMDEQDQFWLDGINADRKRDGEKPVSLEAFEIIFDKLEKEWFDLTKRVPKKLSTLPSEDSKCAICDDGECENSNAIVFCDGCNLAVHQDCYGVPYIPEGQWLCRKCTVSPDKPVICVLCPNSYGAFKQTTNAQWAHLLCAIWIPDTGVSNTVYMEPIDGVENISKNRWKLLCYVCKRKVGACIQCANRNCFTAFHVTCARERGLELKMKQGGERGELRAYCEKHSEGFVAPEGSPLLPETPSGAERSHKKGGGSTASIVLKRTKTGGAKFVLKHKSSKSARAYKKRYTSGPPLVPAFIANRVVEYTKRLKFAKRPQFINQVCRYWSLKREARRGAPLLKRLHLEPWTASATSRQQTDAEKAKKLELLRLLRNDLEKVRMLTELVRKREKKKLERVQVFKGLMDDHIFSKSRLMRDVLDKIAALDKGRIFAQPVSRVAAPTYYDIIKHPMDWATMGEKLDRHEYLTATDFADDIDLVINNARRFNKPDHPIHKLAIKVHTEAQPFLSELESLDAPDSAATQDAAKRAGELSAEYLDELFDYRFYPVIEPTPEPTPEPVPAPTVDKGKGKAKEAAPRDRKSRKRKADQAALPDLAVARASPRVKGTEPSVEMAVDEPAVVPPVPLDVPEPAVAPATTPAPAVPAEVPSLDGKESGARKPRRERSATVAMPVPAHLSVVAPRDTFKHFESGWILPEGQSRRRKHTAPPDGTAYDALASTSAAAPSATPSRKLKVTFAAPAPAKSVPPTNADVPAPIVSAQSISRIDTPAPPAEPETPVAGPPPVDLAPPDTPGTAEKTKNPFKDRDRLRLKRLQMKAEAEEAEQRSLSKGKAKAKADPPTPATPAPAPTATPKSKSKIKSKCAVATPTLLVEAPPPTPAASEEEKARKDEEKRLRTNERRKIRREELKAQKPLEVATPVAPVATDPAPPVATTSRTEPDALLVKAAHQGQREKDAVASDIVPAAAATPAPAPVLAFAPAPMGGTPGPSVTALFQAWRDLRRELEPLVRVTRLDQVPDGTLVWVRFAGSPLWPAEIADPRNPATPPGLAAARPDAEKIARDGEYVLVLYFDQTGTGGWTRLSDLWLLGENKDWDERVCLDPMAIKTKMKASSKGKPFKERMRELRANYDRACAEMEVEEPVDAATAQAGGVVQSTSAAKKRRPKAKKY